jgi:predicted XRE-type DNA-binding protein
MNKNKLIQERTEYLDSIMLELKDLVAYLGYKQKDLASHFNLTRSSISSALNKRGISLNELKYRGAR